MRLHQTIHRSVRRRWLALRRPASNISVTILFLGLCLLCGLVAFSFLDTTNRISGDEHSVCVIQARGLPAGHELAASMDDIHELLTIAPRAQASVAPAPVAVVLTDLNRHLARYQRLEAKQPASRPC